MVLGPLWFRIFSFWSAHYGLLLRLSCFVGAVGRFSCRSFPFPVRFHSVHALPIPRGKLASSTNAVSIDFQFIGRHGVPGFG